MIKSRLMKAVLLGMCMAVFSSTTAFAAESKETLPEETYQMSITSTDAEQPDQVSDEILNKQKEVDKYLFEDHAKEIADKGIQITHTVPLKDYVEIGILPYNDENADYLYQIFGKDMVKVIEGVEVMTIMADDATDTSDTVKATDVAETQDTVTTTKAPETGEDSFPTIPVSIAGIAVIATIIGTSVIIDKRKKLQRR